MRETVKGMGYDAVANCLGGSDSQIAAVGRARRRPFTDGWRASSCIPRDGDNFPLALSTRKLQLKVLMSALGPKRTLAWRVNERPLTGTGLKLGNDCNGRKADARGQRILMTTVRPMASKRCRSTNGRMKSASRSMSAIRSLAELSA